MPNSNIHSNATIINIQSPGGSPEMNQPSMHSHQAPPLKQSPKVEEYKKMIQHIMGKILKRKRPSTFVLVLQPVDQFENDETIDLLIKLRSALMVCHSVGLSSQVLTQRVRTPNATPVSSKVNSPLPSPRIASPSRSPENVGSILPSTIQPRNDKRSEFEKILSVLGDLISNDSRYKAANPKPSVPPFTMQSVLIDIGLILIQMQEDSQSLYSIGLTFLSAFEAFSSGRMLGRLLSLYLDSLLPKLMNQKDIPTDTKKSPEKTLLTVHHKQNTPTISIQSPDQSALKMSHLTIDTQVQTTDSPLAYLTTDAYHTYALFSPLLFFMIEYLDPYLTKPENDTQTQQADSIYNFHRALGFMMRHKSDIYLDLLDIISHSTNAVKYRACQVLFSYYPTSVGHALITQPVSVLASEEDQEPTEDHVWYPHMFETPVTCKECAQIIEGFGLCCYPCKASVHYQCSHHVLKEQGLLYYLKVGGIQKVVTPHFSLLPCEPRFKDRVQLGDVDWTVASNATHVPLNNHQFNLVNLYTLTNCASCHLPLCGVSQQAYRCSACHRLVHPQCLAKTKNCLPGESLVENDLCLTSALLDQSLCDFYKDAMPLKAKELQGRSFEEVSAMLNMLVLQDNIVHYGIASGSIMISDREEGQSVHAFDTGSCRLLSESIKLCLDHLSQCKPFFTTYASFRYILSQDEYLGHLGAMMKSLTTTLFGDVSPTGYTSPGLDKRRSVGDSRGFLQVNPAPPFPSWEEEEENFDQNSHEQLDRSLLLSWMMTNMNFKSRKATEILLQHMRNLGLFERADGSPVVFGADEISQEDSQPIICVFPVPFGIQTSYTVESTLNAIEACLRDVDLSVNECGLLLLIRRCWPDALMPVYARERLIGALLRWTFDEDERLLALHAELTSSKSVNQKQTKWAQTAYARKVKGQNRQSAMFQTAGVSSGASSIYVATRTALKNQYITFWMKTIHDMNEQDYADMLFSAIEDILDNKNETCVVPDWNENFDRKKYTTQKYEQFDKEPAEIKHLAKLCSTKLNGFQVGSAIDILLAQLKEASKESVERGMRWLELVIHSGVGIPSKVLIQITKLMTSANASLEVITKFVKIIWFQIVNVLNAPVAQGDLIEIMGYLHENTLNTIHSYLDSSYHLHEYVKHSVVVIAYAFGCSLDQISQLYLVPSISHRQTHIPTNKRNTLHATNITISQPDENLPIFRCMLQYLDHRQLNEYVIKMFYALSQWGVINKDVFLSRCTPQLIPVVWENLMPSFDYLSNINLDLLMKIIQVNHLQFQSYVNQQFKHESWEIRYQALDNLYGLFSKMDAEFQTVWLKQLCRLGPVFAYFEYVRSKAFALIRAFNTLHLRSAFRCLEAYFLTANEEQRVPLIRQMIELNALFPDWQVLQWDSLLEALEVGSYVDMMDEHAHPLGYDILKSSPETIEEHNIKLHMITLAMQMLSNHLNMTHEQVYRLKFVLVQQMGFKNCHYFNEAGDILIEFGSLVYDPTQVSHTASMITCMRGLKKVMDSFAPLPAEAVAAMTSQSVEHLSENTSPGVYFIDLVFKMMNSGIDLCQLGHTVLRAWLETYLIVIYKHNILDSEYERDIVSSMKSVIELLTSNISEENKLLVLEILKCLLRRSDHLTAMVLSKQILALGKLLTQHGLRYSDPVLLKAKQFLKTAFLRFAVAGLFVLLFKNNTSEGQPMDLFFVLSTVIDPEDTIPDEDVHGEPIYLYDQPVRDVLDKLMKQQMDRKAFSNVLSNTSRYIQTVHSHPYSLSVLNELPSFLNQLIKHTADWRRSDWDINPVLTIAAILLKAHPYQYPSLLSPIQAVFKHGLQHCLVRPKTAAELLAAYASLAAIPNAPTNNVFVDVVLEETKSYLTLANKPNKETMQMLLELILWDLKPMGQSWYAQMDPAHTSYFEKRIDLLPQLVQFLKLSSSSQQFTKKDFKVYIIASHLVVYQCSKDTDLVTQVIGSLKLEETPECLRFLNWFVLVLLSEGMDVLLLKMLDYETIIIDLLVQTLSHIKIDVHHPDPNFLYNRSNEILLLCFILLRTWALLKLRCKSVGDLQDVNQTSFWFSIWPSLRRTMEIIEPVSLFTAGSVGVYIWDMFLSLIQFLFVARSEAVVINAYEWSIILEDLLEKLNEIGNHDFMKQEQEAEQVVSMANFKRRINRIKSMFETPPLELPESTLINQLLLELRDIMRLEVESVNLQGNNRILTHTLA
ncbi:hypothetical protein CU098_009425 [Rhizopus stolonifer]|uniref:Phorbol-ester/DAG-type domain-containing protein n=1 Tax=Rhizopus stolonifer TaxID=4846 RepID=A0A367KVQ1_RHIST|nr:hypothetical protein CU098_009425 [Rhizopus stolonifer]